MLEVAIRGFDEVAEDWRSLYQASGQSPFLVLSWHRALHELVAERRGSRGDLAVAEIRDASRIVGLATIGRAWSRHLRVLSSRLLCLNETGEPSFDRLNLEHNGVLADVEREGEVLLSLVSYLLERDDWDEISLGWMDEKKWHRLCRHLSRLPLVPWQNGREPYYVVDLRRVGCLEDYLRQLSTNTRQQIRRALRQYGGTSQLSVQAARDPTVAQEWLQDMIDLHQSRWQRRGRSGAFADPFMREFHMRLVDAGIPEGDVQLLRVAHPRGTVGILYNIYCKGYLCNYQGGFAYQDDQKFKPGLVSHALAVDFAASKGFRYYDLLMGDSQYKRSLARKRREMVHVLLQRRRWRLALNRKVQRWRTLG